MANRTLKSKTNKDLNQHIVVLEKSIKSLKDNYNILEKKMNKILIKLNDDTKKVENKENLHTSNTEKIIKCKTCNIIVQNKKELKTHIKSIHPKTREVKCNDCNKVFQENWELELHMIEHDKRKQFTCDICEKSFFLEWRLNKHMRNHSNTKKICCHYYNNSKPCPFEDIGCMFEHEQSKLCQNKNDCKRVLCQFRHENSVEKNDSKSQYDLLNK